MHSTRFMREFLLIRCCHSLIDPFQGLPVLVTGLYGRVILHIFIKECDDEPGSVGRMTDNVNC